MASNPTYVYDTTVKGPTGVPIRFDSDTNGTLATITEPDGDVIAQLTGTPGEPTVFFTDPQTGAIPRAFGNAATVYVRRADLSTGASIGSVIATITGGTYQASGSSGGLSQSSADARYARKNTSVFLLDAYGADPTGATSSDGAWTAAYTAAAAAVSNPSTNTYGGAMIVAGAGTYKFSPNVVKLSDNRIGFIGQGKLATTLFTTGSTGDIVYATNTNWAGTGAASSADVGDFTINMTQAGANVNGFHYGDRAGATIRPVRVEYAQSSGSRAFWFRNDNGGLSERVRADLEAIGCVISFDFDGNNGAVSSVPISFDYGDFRLRMVTGTITGVSPIGVRFCNNVNLVGCNLRLSGNLSAASGQSGVLFQVGNSGTDTAKFTNSTIDATVENLSGTVYDINVTAAAAWQDIFGNITLINGGANFTAGTVSAGGILKSQGMLIAPIFSSASGQLQKIASALWTFDSTNGAKVILDANAAHINAPSNVNGGAGIVTATVGTAGNGASASVAGNDFAGIVTITTASTGVTASTDQVAVNLTWSTAFGNSPRAVVLVPTGSNTVGGPSTTVGAYANAFNSTSWQILFHNAPAASTTYQFAYICVGR